MEILSQSQQNTRPGRRVMEGTEQILELNLYHLKLSTHVLARPTLITIGMAQDLSHFHIFSEREFSVYWQLYQKYKVGYTVGIASNTFPFLFRDNLAVNLKPGDWQSLTNKKDIVLSYYDPQGSVGHWASNHGTASGISDVIK